MLNGMFWLVELISCYSGSSLALLFLLLILLLVVQPTVMEAQKLAMDLLYTARLPTYIPELRIANLGEESL